MAKKNIFLIDILNSRLRETTKEKNNDYKSFYKRIKSSRDSNPYKPQKVYQIS